MPLYGVAQSGGSLTALIPGDSYVLFNGTETPGAGVNSVAINRAEGPGPMDAGITFQTVFATAPTATVLIQGSNVDANADYVTLFTSTSKQFDGYTDTARWAFYRAVLSTYTVGGMPVVIVQR